ncbi:hypothetical protein [Actinomadura darangshiensis]|uniref:hypothetical protein n=1 Tax=Actinomadura darangshiensis TaxID=705336 RepID=UPI0014093E4E|nr:hypothetical protein [Actinomadura darangshiensis]
MTGLAVAMDVVAAGFFAFFLVLVIRKGTVQSDEGGRSVAMALIAVSLGLLSVPLWSLP